MWCAQSTTEKWLQRKQGQTTFSLDGGCGGEWGDKQRPFSCWGLMVSFWSLISDPCYMNSSRLEFIAPHWFLLAPILHCSCLYLFEVWCVLKQNEPDFPYCLCQCLVMGSINSFTARLLTIVMHPSSGGRQRDTDPELGKFKQARAKAKGRYSIIYLVSGPHPFPNKFQPGYKK